MEIYYSFSLLIVVATLFSYLNKRWLKLPSTIGIMVIAIFFSVLIVSFGENILSATVLSSLKELATEVDFKEVLMGAMLNFLLFASGIHIKLSDLKDHRRAITFFATISVVITAFLSATAIYYISEFILMPMPFIECLIFGALIAPTDPIAALSVLKEAKVSKSLQANVAGESLFNDGTSIVLFMVVVQMAIGKDHDITVLGTIWLFIHEFFGGLIVGFLLGFIAKKMILRTNDYKIAVMSTLSIVMGGYILCKSLHVSAPLAMVSAGLFIGNMRFPKAKRNNELRDYLGKFWEITDDILNAILFLFIGLQVIVIPNLQKYWQMGLVAIFVVLLARFMSIYIPAKTIKFRNKIDNHMIKVLTWGGIRGGVSIALALAIPNEIVFKDAIVAITYFVVVFSIIVQGLSIGIVADEKKKVKLQIPKEYLVGFSDDYSDNEDLDDDE